MIFRNKRIKIWINHGEKGFIIEVTRRQGDILFCAISENEKELGEDISDVRKILQRYSKTALRWFNKKMRK